MTRLVSLAVLCASCFALALSARYGLIEPSDQAALCRADPTRWTCLLKEGLVSIFAHQRLGFFALTCAALALLTQAHALAWLALIAGCFGLVLYCPELSAPSLVLGALILAKS